MMTFKTVTQNDYKFIESNEEDWYGIELTTGKWKGIQYIYGKVSVKESPELDNATLHFSYNLINSNGFEEDDLLNDINFKNYLGGILQNIIEDSLDNGDFKIGNNLSDTNSYIKSSN